MYRNDTSMLPDTLVSHAVSIGPEICWPAAHAEDVVCVLAAKHQVVLGVEAWDLSDAKKARVLDWTWYRAEDYFSRPQSLIDKCKQLALEFIRNTTPIPNLCFQIEWARMDELGIQQ